MKSFTKFFKDNSELIVLTLIPIIAAIPHAYNMFHYPYYENDEGVYMSQAWSIIKQGKMAPYTYWYDHAPGGWIFIAIWTMLTGGFFSFGFSINSGRVFMLFLHIFSSLFLYLIAKKITTSKLTGLLSVIIFSFSPLGIYFQRRVLLDNIMIFWILLSLIFILYNGGKLRVIIVSGLLFGIGSLSKENSIFFIPFFLYCIYIFVHKSQRNFALCIWTVCAGVLIAFYFLYAFTKGEFFPAGTFLGGSHPHVSLLGTLKDQYSRSGGGMFDLHKSSFWVSMWSWLEEDPVIIITGIIATIINGFIGISSYYRVNDTERKQMGFALLFSSFFSLSLWLFLIRGGLVIEFYIIPLIPILALNIAVLSWYMGKKLQQIFFQPLLYSIPIIITGILFGATSFYFSTNVRNNQNLFTSDQTTPQIQAINWILHRNNPHDFFVIDNYGYIELHEKGYGKFKNAEWYWKVDRDPEIFKKILKGQPNGIDYIALTPQMEHDITTAGLNLTQLAWHKSQSIARFWNDGWGVEFWATKFDSRIIRSSWESYKIHFIHDGQVIDPYTNGTTSETQSYALLRSVWMNDQKTFDTVWNWTQTNLQQPDGLFIWKWNPQGTDTGTASDADSDLALALLFASKRWNSDTYLEEGRQILNGIWNHEVVSVKNLPYMTAANWANHTSAITVNPSYLSPASYRVFGMADSTHPWNKLIGTTYWLLNHCTKAKLDVSKGVLPPEWCSLDTQTLAIAQPGQFQPRDTEYSYNAFRTPWRVALDYVWFQSPDAKKYLSTLSFLSDQYKNHGKLSTAYTHDGKIWESYESVAAYSGNIGYFLVINPTQAKKIYEQKIFPKYFEEENQNYWEDPKNYYTQNWAWFGTALYSNSLQNLWDINR